MLKKFLAIFFVVLTYSFEVCAVPGTHMGRLLYRVLTEQCGRHAAISPEALNLFLLTHWIKHRPSEDFEGVMLPSAPKDVFPHVTFHQELGERILKRVSLNDKRHSRRKIPNQIERTDAQADINPNKEAFIPGHFYKVQGETQVSKLFIALNDDPPRMKSPRFTTWFMPLEQALMPQYVEDYRTQVALLKRWAAYSRFSLGFIPARTKISLRIGLVAPQAFPNIRKDVYGTHPHSLEEFFDKADIHKVRESLSKLNIPPEAIYEFRKGGAMQILIAHAGEPTYLLPLNAIYVNGAPYTPTYSRKTPMDKDVWPSLYPGEVSHFLDDKLDKAEINIPRALGPEGLRILSRREQRDWEDVLRAVRHQEEILF